MLKIKQQCSAKNISKSSQGSPQRNIRCLHPILRPACEHVPQLSGGFRSRALYCPSTMYPQDTHSLINVRPDLLNLFSFLLTAILFPLDRPDGVHVCVSERVCSRTCRFRKRKEKKGEKYPDRQDICWAFHIFHQSVPCLGKKKQTDS